MRCSVVSWKHCTIYVYRIQSSVVLLGITTQVLFLVQVMPIHHLRWQLAILLATCKCMMCSGCQVLLNNTLLPTLTVWKLVLALTIQSPKLGRPWYLMPHTHTRVSSTPLMELVLLVHRRLSLVAVMVRWKCEIRVSQANRWWCCSPLTSLVRGIAERFALATALTRMNALLPPGTITGIWSCLIYERRKWYMRWTLAMEYVTLPLTGQISQWTS